MKGITLTPKTKVLTNQDKAVLELAMMNGRLVPCNITQVEQVLKYCIPVVASNITDLDTYTANVVELLKHKYTDTERDIIALCFNKVYDMPCITFVLKDEELGTKYSDLITEDGDYACCYVLNLASDWCSEFGDCYFANDRRTA